MTSLITVAEYRTYTLDTAASDDSASAAIPVALEWLESLLGGRLVGYRADYTETVQGNAYGEVWPSLVPVLSVSSPDSVTILDNGHTLKGIDPVNLVNDILLETAEYSTAITYTGGYTQSTAPFTLKKIIARLTKALLTHGIMPGDATPGVTSVSLGDASMSFAEARSYLETVAPGLCDDIEQFRRSTGWYRW